RRPRRGPALDREGGPLQLRLERPPRHRPRLLRRPVPLTIHGGGLRDAEGLVASTEETTMTETIQTQLDALAELRLPDLQERFAEFVGEETRCPNKTYLLRRIREALEARAAAPAPAPTPAADGSATEEDDVRLRDLDVEQL